MSESKDIQNIKFSSLLHALEDLGYKSSISLGQNKYRLFLNKKSSSGISIISYIISFLKY